MRVMVTDDVRFGSQIVPGDGLTIWAMHRRYGGHAADRRH